jgi:hypothetical protein
MDLLSPGYAIGAALVTLAGCYAPSLRDCTVSCASQRDCAGEQLCGSDGLCASPEVAGRCAAPSPAPDAGPELDAGPTRDAASAVIDAAPDAPPMIALRVQVMGHGSIVVVGHGVCSSEDAQHGDCTFDVAPHVAQTVQAVPVLLDEGFASWTSQTCKSQGASCTFTPVIATAVAAKFVKR